MTELRPHRLAFICTANICRSPMAAGLARDYAARRGWPVEIRSGGIMGIEGHPGSPNAVTAVKELGIDISDHRSGGVDAELVEWADYLLVMELRHQMHIHSHFPQSDGKVLLLGTFGGVHEIRDPIGSWLRRYRKSRDEIKRCVERFMDNLPPPQPAEQPQPAE